ncbi:MAG: hypothetical protein LJE85_15085 [Gammaproteobacteria bacterium]|jgi:hypothetical protein|nr:hypothetical protein [Gammaproteobacteria bacterium]
MSSRKFEPPLHIELTPSRWLLILLLTIHIGAALLVLFFQTWWLVKFVLLVCLLASAVVSLHKTAWIHGPLLDRLLFRWQSIPTMTWQSDNDWQLFTANGRYVQAQLLPTSTCQPVFVALNFRTDNSRWLDRYISVVIFADAIDQEIFRQLRVRLRTRFVQAQDN